jgi:ABC-type lipoprotein export system ATPase subunit
MMKVELKIKNRTWSIEHGAAGALINGLRGCVRVWYEEARVMAAPTASTVVRLEHVSKAYRRGEAVVAALQGVSLQVAHGEFCALMGPSGCGKSTLLNLVAGLDRPTSGDVQLDGRSTRNLSDTDWTTVRRSLIGMVFQSFHLLPTLTAEENVQMPLLLQGVSGATAKARAAESLDRVGMRARAQHRSGELSGGEQQRVAIARALVHRPRLILADEPTGNLDSQSGGDVIALLKAVSKELKQTILLVTHSEEAARVADRICRMRDGRLEAAA